MTIEHSIPQIIDWANSSEEESEGETGFTLIKTKKFGDIQILLGITVSHIKLFQKPVRLF